MTPTQAQEDPYLIREARKRRVSVELLVSMMLDIVAKDQMVLAILDDAEEVRARQFPAGAKA